MPEVPEVSAGDGAALVEAGAFLLDVREQEEWDAGHAPGAHHIPLSQLGARASEVPEDRQVVAVCKMGGRSAAATDALNRAGYDVVNLAGGMQAWAEAGLAVVSAEGAPGTVI